MTTENTRPTRELRSGVPDTLLDPLTVWLEEQCARGADLGEPYSRSLFQTVEATFARSLIWSDGTRSAFDSLITRAHDDRAFFLDLIDLVLTRCTPQSNEDDRAAVEQLERILDEADSVWTVSSTSPSALERRVEPPLDALVRDVITSGTPAGDELRNAWRYAWGRRGNASVAYRATLRAVEAALGPVIVRDGAPPTLVGLIAALRDDLATFEVRPGADETLPDAAAVLDAMESLQQGIDHGRGAGYPQDPLTVSVPQTQAATITAARLIHLAQSNGLTHRS